MSKKILSVYGLFDDATNEMVYVGISSNPKNRLSSHLCVLAKDFKDTCRMEILESSADTSEDDESFWIEYCCAIGCNLFNKRANPHYQNAPSKHVNKPYAVRIPRPLYDYYASTAKGMGVPLGKRIQSVLALYAK